MERVARIYQKNKYANKADFQAYQVFNYKTSSSSASGYVANNTKPNEARFTILESSLLNFDLFQTSTTRGADNYTDYVCEIREDNKVVFTGIIKSTVKKKWKEYYGENEIQITVADWVALYKIAEKANLISQCWRGYLFDIVDGDFNYTEQYEAKTLSQQIRYIHNLADYNYFAIDPNEPSSMPYDYSPVVGVSVIDREYNNASYEKTVLGFGFWELLNKIDLENWETGEVQVGIIKDQDVWAICVCVAKRTDVGAEESTVKVINRLYGLDSDLNLSDGAYFDKKIEDFTNGWRIKIKNRNKFIDYNIYAPDGVEASFGILNSSPINGNYFINGEYFDVFPEPSTKANGFYWIYNRSPISLGGGSEYSTGEWVFNDFLRITVTNGGQPLIRQTGTKVIDDGDRKLEIVTKSVWDLTGSSNDYLISFKTTAKYSNDSILALKDNYVTYKEARIAESIVDYGFDNYTKVYEFQEASFIEQNKLEDLAYFYWVEDVLPPEEGSYNYKSEKGYNYKDLLDWIIANSKVLFFSENDHISVEYLQTGEVKKTLQSGDVIELNKRSKKQKIESPKALTFINEDVVKLHFDNQANATNSYAFELQNIELKKGDLIEFSISDNNKTCRVTSVKKDPLFDFIKYTAEEVN